MKATELAAVVQVYMPEVRRAAFATSKPLAALAGAVRGIAAMTGAILKGDYADEAEQTARRTVCRSCPAARASGTTGEAAVWCGEPLVKVDGETGGKGATCGCLLPVMVLVKGKACPRGHF